MFSIRLCLNAVLLVVTVALGAAGTALAKPATIIAFELAQPDAILSSPKDAELRASLAAVPARWDGLVESLGMPEFEQAAPFVDLVFTLATRPMRFAITDVGADPDTGAPGLGVAWRREPNLSYRSGARGIGNHK